MNMNRNLGDSKKLILLSEEYTNILKQFNQTYVKIKNINYQNESKEVILEKLELNYLLSRLDFLRRDFLGLILLTFDNFYFQRTSCLITIKELQYESFKLRFLREKINFICLGEALLIDSMIVKDCLKKVEEEILKVEHVIDRKGMELSDWEQVEHEFDLLLYRQKLYHANL